MKVDTSGTIWASTQQYDRNLIGTFHVGGSWKYCYVTVDLGGFRTLLSDNGIAAMDEVIAKHLVIPRSRGAWHGSGTINSTHTLNENWKAALVEMLSVIEKYAVHHEFIVGGDAMKLSDVRYKENRR